MKTIFIIIFLSILCFSSNHAQINEIPAIQLNEILVKEPVICDILRMPCHKDNVIYAGKKNEVIQFNKLAADLSTNNTRQVFSKVPGMSIWENDGSGIQVGVATRGLSPNRSWEFNVRQNGYDISSEVFGYPETYYTPPMEALDRIEVVRGAASLQYGPQFGGLLNYKIKKGNPNQKITFESQQTIGSYGLFNTYNAIGGTLKKLTYYAFFQHRSADSWRKNSVYSIYSGHVSLTYKISPKLIVEGEYSAMKYKSQQAGGLTDSEFNENHQQSFRKRNWFSAPFNVASLTLKYDISKKINLQLKSFATIAQRNSVGFLGADTIDPVSLEYKNRQVDRDYYTNYGTELRATYKYKLVNCDNLLAAGLRAYNGATERKQKGIGTNGHDFDLTLTQPVFGRSLKYQTINYAAFAENMIQIGSRFKVIPGIRFEFIENTSEGYINTESNGKISPTIKQRNFLLYGIGSEFKVSEKTNLYANYSLSYRPVTFSELTPSATLEVIDPNLKDANGYNADIGFRGTAGNFLSFDIGVFYLNYENRVGTYLQDDGTLFKTNIGNSVSKGIESYIEIDITKIINDKSKIGNLVFFASNSFIDAKYSKWENPEIANDPDRSIENKCVENAPKYIHRFGTSYYFKGFTATFQLSKVGAVYTDAANTELPNSSGTIGKISAYQVMDFSLVYKFKERYNVKAGITNLTDEKYATRRATGYPGPGILPGNGRTFYLGLGLLF